MIDLESLSAEELNDALLEVFAERKRAGQAYQEALEQLRIAEHRVTGAKAALGEAQVSVERVVRSDLASVLRRADLLGFEGTPEEAAL